MARARKPTAATRTPRPSRPARPAARRATAKTPAKARAKATAKASEWRVRPARLEDEEAILALWREMASFHGKLLPRFFLSDAGRDPGRRHHDARRLRAALRERGRALLVAERPGSGLGPEGLLAIRLHGAPDDPSLVPLKRAQLEELVVAPGRRRSGCGRALVAAAHDWARAQGAEQVVLTVWAGNTTAERFYRTLGFRVVSQVLTVDL